MEEKLFEDKGKTKLWKKVLSVILAVIIGFGTIVTLIVGSSHLQSRLGINAMLSAYAAEIVDTKGTVAVNEGAMLADSNVIDLENRDGSNTVYVFSEPISFTDENGKLKTKDISVEKQRDKALKAEGYEYANGQNDYRINFSTDSSKGLYIQFGNSSYSIIPKSDFAVSGKESTSDILKEEFEDFEYKNIYGVGTNLKFYPQLNGVKDEIVLNQNIDKNTFSFELKTENCTAVLNEDGTVFLVSKDDNEAVQTFSAPFAYDSEYVEGEKSEHYIDCSYTLKQIDDNTYDMTVNVDKSWLESSSTVYPVTIDPTTSNLDNYRDAGIYNSSASKNICYGKETTCCFGRASEYGYGRVLNQFTMPDGIKKGAKINSAYTWQRETTGRTTSTKVTPHFVTSAWYEGDVTWETRPSYSSVVGTTKTINSKSTDDPNNSYWYKFSIADMVKKWADGEKNYGFCFVSSEETDKNYNWRAFTSKQYSSSAMRPYTVINYTNDTTAPTISSVTGNPTAWTNASVTLTINGAADNSGGAGLHSTPYSFSTTKGSYNWQSGKTKTFSTNCTVYIYVRDSLGNIALRSTVTINKIDKTKPNTPSVSGNPSEWTNSSVTLTASADDKSATSSYGKSGIKDYSFSTKKGTYSWQTSNKKSFSSNTTVYVYSRDNAGNISDPEEVVISKIDKTAPTAPTIELDSAVWTNGGVILTAFSSDTQSGVKQYSFSAEKGEYNWQSSNKKSFSDNGKIYVSAKDNVGNISGETEVKIANIDLDIPVITKVTSDTNAWTNEKITLTALATDESSDIVEYSFSTSADEFDWQTSNSKTIYEQCKIYVCAKDEAGNISAPYVVDLKIDKLSPTGTVFVEEPTDWVRKVVIMVNASDDVSGLHTKPYSFSSEEGKYTWQYENTKAVTSNGTYYIYVRDSAENITLLDTVTIDKIDSTVPAISNVEINENDDYVVATITASDSQSGVAEYSIDNGLTWQESNIFRVDKNSISVISAKVKDKVGNVSSSKSYNMISPKAYFENGKLGLYNPNLNGKCDIYYRFNTTTNWTQYEKPVDIPENAELAYVSFFNPGWAQKYQTNFPKIPVERQDVNLFAYAENNTDLSLSYNNLTFDINRLYVNDEWKYSLDSSLKYLSDGALIEAVLPDTNTYVFVRENKYSYINESQGYELSVIYDENDENIIEYVVTCAKNNYHYNAEGTMIKVSNEYDTSFSFSYSDNSIMITDGAERQTEIKYNSGKISSITDAAGGVINYIYDEDNLVKVTDQTGVIIGKYEYNNNILEKSGKNSIIRDSQDRVIKLLSDNGYYVNYEYTDNTVAITTVDEPLAETVYDYSGNILTSTDKYGDVTEYVYDSSNRLIEVVKGDKVLNTYTYDSNNNITKTVDSDGNSVIYNYDEQNRLITQLSGKKDVVHYLYEDNLVVKITLNDSFPPDTYHRTVYNPYWDEYYDKAYYRYESGMLVEIDDSEANNTVTNYSYDKYGNVSKTTNTVTEDDKTVVSVSESTYDILNRLVLSKSDNSEISYTYDAAGRTLLTNADGAYQRTVYDNYGRVVQEISDSDYNPELDNLPDAYSDTSVGHRYEYDNVGNLVKEINDFDIETDYAYSDIGTISRKSFDIYDYYYQKDGSYDKIEVNGETIIDYDYKVTDSDITLKDGQYINRTTYADGYVEEQKYNKSSYLIEKYANNQIYYSNKPTSSLVSEYYDYENGYKNSIAKTKYVWEYTRDTLSDDKLNFRYNSRTLNNGDVSNFEIHFDKHYDTDYKNDKIIFGTPNSQFTYSVNCEDNIILEKFDDENNVLSSEIIYDEDNKILKKTYDLENLDFSIAYDDNRNIISDENNKYSYGEYGELIKTSNASVESLYTYDDRGNILSKMDGENETIFSYDSKKWQDQLTAVNDNPLTYDANGNLHTYNGDTYTWEKGKILKSISNSNINISYKYDNDGYRLSKTVNGVETKFNVINGKILAQYSDTDRVYFQYNGITPIGFVYNDVQYFYITNLSGDIVGITDKDGNLIAEYSYDDWGKLLDIETAAENNEEQLAIAEINPFRYRGYYYDNETGMYYLQSRYYNPELCRFISADGFDYIDTSSPISVNAYAYCQNNPVKWIDPVGCDFAAGIGTAIVFSIGIMTGLFLIYVMIYAVVAGLTGTTVGMPNINFSISIPTATERADANIKATIKNPKGCSYWIANQIGSYVAISSPLSFKDALFRVSIGADVFAIDKFAAYDLAYAAGGAGKWPIGPEIDKGKEYVTGYYWHYHPNPRNGAHIFYL